MAIYSCWGETVEIVAYCGKHQPKGFNFPMMLVQCKYPDGEVRYVFATYLRADGGINAIEAAIAAAPEAVLTGAALRAALKQAE